MPKVEHRSGGTLQATGKRLTGYALVYGTTYSVGGAFDERIAPGAADRAIREAHDVRLLVNHTGVPLARTKSGTLRLRSDAHGLRVEADLDDSSPDAQSTIAALRRGDIDAMSFGFKVPQGGDRWDGNVRTITDFDLLDVSVVAFPANAATTASVRSTTPARATSRPARRAPTPPQRLRALRYSTRGTR